MCSINSFKHQRNIELKKIKNGKMNKAGRKQQRDSALFALPHFRWIKELLKIKMQNHSQTNQVRMASAELDNI